MKHLVTKAIAATGILFLAGCVTTESDGPRLPSYGEQCVSSVTSLSTLPDPVRTQKQMAEIDHCLAGPVDREHRIRLIAAKLALALTRNESSACNQAIGQLQNETLLDRTRSERTVEQISRIKAVCELRASGDMNDGLRSLVASGRRNGIYFK